MKEEEDVALIPLYKAQREYAVISLLMHLDKITRGHLRNPWGRPPFLLTQALSCHLTMWCYNVRQTSSPQSIHHLISLAVS